MLIVVMRWAQYPRHVRAAWSAAHRVVFSNYEVEGCLCGGEFLWSSSFTKWTTGGIINNG